MNIVLLAGVWLSLGVIFCLVSGRGIAAAQTPASAPRETPAAPAVAAPAPREFASLAVHEWALAAANVATDELMSTRPGAIRRVATR